MLDKKQDQAVGDGASALQAGGDITVINTGITVLEARAIALDVAKATFYELSGVARDTAASRVEEITNQVIERLEKEYPAGLQKAQDPDFQYSLLTVQKEFARNGDTDLGSLLVDLLVDRSKQDQRDILQIVLNESLATAPKLTNSQLSALALIFLFRYTQNTSVGNHDLFGNYLDRCASPFVDKLPKSQASYQHLEFAGCGTALVGPPLEEQLGNTYQGLFLNGFSSEEIEPPRKIWRLHSLRRWSYEQSKQVLPGSPGTVGEDGAGAPRRVRVAVGGDRVGGGQGWLHGRDAARLASPARARHGQA